MTSRGFSLLELLVTLAIVALLAALAWPGYGAIIQRAQRNDARLALLTIQHAEESHYQRFNAYTEALTLPGSSGGLGLAALSSNGSYALSVSTSDDGQHYSATARVLAQGRQSRDHACASLLIDETGQRAATDASGADSTDTCWRR
jgi:type IV pilus assembly protein PilE